MDIKQLTETLFVSGQIKLADLKILAQSGFSVIVNNRPDGEALCQPKSNALAKRAKDLGLAYHYIPVYPGKMSTSNVENFDAVLNGLKGKTLAFCRTGTRSTHLWAKTQVGKRSADDVISRGNAAGYDLSEHRAALEAGL